MNPQSRLWLCKTNLENDYKNTLTFASVNAQRNYFIGNPADPSSHGVSTKVYNDFTYLRIENAIKVDDFIENIDTNNYLVLINNNKYYYYFITSMDYIDDQTTKINIEIDVMQTYYFDIEYKQTFIEREHVTDDTAGKHTIPEGLETGEYIVGRSGNLELNNTFDEWSVVMAVTLDDELFPDLGTVFYGGCFSGTVYLEFSGINVGQAGAFIKCMNSAQKLDAITSIFMLPSFLLEVEGYRITFDSVTITCNRVTTTYDADELSIPVGTKPTALGNYTPRNKKLLINDYNYLLLDNGVGGTKKYNFEDFNVSGSANNIYFDYISTPTPSGSVLIAPRNYKNVTQNLLESFAGGKFPICSWSADSYTNWLTQTGVNRAFSYGEDVVKTLLGATITAGSIATGNIYGAMLGGNMVAAGIQGGVEDIAKDVQERKNHEDAPNELRGNESLGDVAFAHFRCIPKYYYMHIKEEYARVIDKYFDMFGYQVNIVKAPSIHTRSNWNYLKTRSCNFTGDIPQEYMVRIKSIFDKGITFWHNPSTMLDYSQTNSVIS